MVAEDGKIYAQICHGKCHWIFTKNELPEWNNDMAPAVDITDMEVKPEEGWDYVDGVFTPPKPYVPTEEEIRAIRDKLLIELDEVVLNPLRFASFTDEQKAELATYRQALLDVPQQAGFPSDVTWPEKPTFI